MRPHQRRRTGSPARSAAPFLRRLLVALCAAVVAVVAFAGQHTADTNAATLTTLAPFRAVDDASVKQVSPTSNFGSSASLNSDSGTGVAMESYLRFTVTGVGAATVASARLRLFVPSDATVDGPGVYGCSAAACATWKETGITWNTRAPRASTATADVGAIKAGTFVEWDVTPLITGDGTYTLVIGPTPTTDGTVFSSDEASTNRPQLVVTVSTDQAPPPPQNKE